MDAGVKLYAVNDCLMWVRQIVDDLHWTEVNSRPPEDWEALQTFFQENLEYEYYAVLLASQAEINNIRRNYDFTEPLPRNFDILEFSWEENHFEELPVELDEIYNSSISLNENLTGIVRMKIPAEITDFKEEVEEIQGECEEIAKKTHKTLEKTLEIVRNI